MSEQRRQVERIVDFESSVNAIRAYFANEHMAIDAVQHISGLPQTPGTESERDAFKRYASALRSFLICGIDDPSWAAALVQLCVRIEGVIPGYWDERERIICRVLSTGRLTKSDWYALSRSGVLLDMSDDPRGGLYTGTELVKAIDASVPKAPWETNPDDDWMPPGDVLI